MERRREKPELVAPAGSWAALSTALASGADSIYFGIKNLNMRNLASNFDMGEIGKVMNTIHKKKKRGYLALNVIIYNRELGKVENILKIAKKEGVDAVILWDMAAFQMAKDTGLKIHLSTQASVANSGALKTYSRLGAKRIVLARECNLSDIREIIELCEVEKIDCEIEAFIHGAMCVSISGRCFLSQYSFFDSANRGECLQPCRREFIIKDVQDECEYEIGKDYVLSPKDLCTIGFIDKLILTGVKALKIEGRIRSPEYIKVVTSVYRRAIDSFFKGELNQELKEKLINEARSVYNRGFSEGFYKNMPCDISSNIESEYEKVYLGEVRKFYKKISVAEILVRNGVLKKGQTLLFIGNRSTPASFAKVEDIQVEHTPVSRVEKGGRCGVKLPYAVRSKDKVFIWRRKTQW
ncbi:MAG: U32 family peptidase [Candidatus Omnitrophica bacterium]|nr:U32 family peptidase [Candidatus Omnitrophota bacterium]